MQQMLNPPITEHLKLKFDLLLSTFAFEFNVCRYSKGAAALAAERKFIAAERQARSLLR